MGVPNNIALERCLGHVLRPCALSMITTAIGFGSLVFSDSQPVREFGLAATVGVVLAFVLNVTVLPALLLMVPEPSSERSLATLGRFVARISHASACRPIGVLSVGLVLCVIPSMFLWQLDVNVDPLSFFRRSSPQVEDLRVADQALGGVHSVEVLLEGSPGSMVEPELLHWMQDFAEFATSDAQIDSSLSIEDLVSYIRTVEDGSVDRLTSGQVRSLLFLYELGGGASALRSVVDYDHNSIGRMSLRKRADGSQGTVRSLRRLNVRLNEHPPPHDVRATITGASALLATAGQRAVESLLASFGVAAITIWLSLVIVLRSPSVAIIAMIPNILPVLVAFGVLGAIGGSLDAPTAMIACIGVGLAVNDTIHLADGVLKEVREGMLFDAALMKTAKRVAVPIVVTSVSLAVGLGVLVFGEFQPTLQLGLGIGTAVLVALVCDLTIFPALLASQLGSKRLVATRLLNDLEEEEL